MKSNCCTNFWVYGKHTANKAACSSVGFVLWTFTIMAIASFLIDLAISVLYQEDKWLHESLITASLSTGVAALVEIPSKIIRECYFLSNPPTNKCNFVGQIGVLLLGSALGWVASLGADAGYNKFYESGSHHNLPNSFSFELAESLLAAVALTFVKAAVRAGTTVAFSSPCCNKSDSDNSSKTKLQTFEVNP